ncbi:MAG TPA: hypothetical protein VMS29_07905 [Pyrinomonadaceae bacterium]|nr:hypothetical protein [Pyrinomonadaceae bacterium]
MWKSRFVIFVFVVVGGILVTDLDAQTKKKKTSTNKTPAAVTANVAANKEEPKPQPTPVESITKRNERPNGKGVPAATPTPPAKSDPYYTYEFTQPEFITTRILIEHDDKGTGKFSFTRRGNDELITDPLQISVAAIERLKGAYTALNFHDSTESYQYEKDFSHLGVIKISMTKGGRERAATFNYTVNKTAKLLADEYRKIGNQALWIFDIKLARENQPLDSPNQMNSLESMLKRDEISDPSQLLPFLSELSDDERLPLLARNHATRISQQIEKKIAKSK